MGQLSLDKVNPMNFKSQLSSHIVSVWVALYIAVFLNALIFWRHLDIRSETSIAVTALSVVGLSSATFVLLSLARMFGRRFYKAFTGFLILSSAAAAFYMIVHHVVIGYGVIASVLTTDVDLHGEQFGARFITWMVLLGIVPTIMVCLCQLDQAAKGRKRTVAYTLIAIITAVCSFKTMDAIERHEAKQKNTFAPSPSGRIAHTYLPSNWLSALGLFAYEKFKSAEDAQLLDPAQKFAYSAPADLADAYVVFVLGETTRSDHMGLLGYARDTTPKLQQETNLFAFRGVSCDTATKLSLRCMFVRPEGVSDNEQRSLTQKNVFSVLRQLGFSIELFSLQSEVWFYRKVHANDYKIREMIAAQMSDSNRRVDDRVLNEQVLESLKKYPKGKHVIVLHTKGSHYAYSERHPESFAQFKPECKSNDAACSLDALINSFDNSVLYVDTMLSELLDILRDKKAIVFYTSDHGESLSENMHFHATPRKKAPAEQFRVPYLVWMSESFKTASPANEQAFANLQQLQSQQAILPHQTLFASILGCAGITSSSEGGIVPTQNICNSSFEVDPSANMLPSRQQPIYP